MGTSALKEPAALLISVQGLQLQIEQMMGNSSEY
jgi:hypothetical protein